MQFFHTSIFWINWNAFDCLCTLVLLSGLTARWQLIWLALHTAHNWQKPLLHLGIVRNYKLWHIRSLHVLSSVGQVGPDALSLCGDGQPAAELREGDSPDCPLQRRLRVAALSTRRPGRPRPQSLCQRRRRSGPGVSLSSVFFYGPPPPGDRFERVQNLFRRM